MAESVHTNFPSQVVSDLEKITEEYGLKIAKAIEINETLSGDEIKELIKAINFIISNKFFNGKTLKIDGGL